MSVGRSVVNHYYFFFHFQRHRFDGCDNLRQSLALVIYRNDDREFHSIALRFCPNHIFLLLKQTRWRQAFLAIYCHRKCALSLWQALPYFQWVQASRSLHALKNRVFLRPVSRSPALPPPSPLEMPCLAL